MFFLKKKKKAAESKLSPNEIVADYGEVIEKNEKDWLVCKPESLLPYSKDQIKDAIKTVMLGVDDEHLLENLITCYSMLADFVPNEDAKFVRNHWQSFENLERLRLPQDPQRKKEILDKIGEDTEKCAAIMKRTFEESQRLLNEIREHRKRRENISRCSRK